MKMILLTIIMSLSFTAQAKSISCGLDGAPAETDFQFTVLTQKTIVTKVTGVTVGGFPIADLDFSEALPEKTRSEVTANRITVLMSFHENLVSDFYGSFGVILNKQANGTYEGVGDIILGTENFAENVIQPDPTTGKWKGFNILSMSGGVFLYLETLNIVCADLPR